MCREQIEAKMEKVSILIQTVSLVQKISINSIDFYTIYFYNTLLLFFNKCVFLYLVKGFDNPTCTFVLPITVLMCKFCGKVHSLFRIDIIYKILYTYILSWSQKEFQTAGGSCSNKVWELLN